MAHRGQALAHGESESTTGCDTAARRGLCWRIDTRTRKTDSVSSSETADWWTSTTADGAASDRIHRSLEARVGERQGGLDRIVTIAQRLIPSCIGAELATVEGNDLRVLARSATIPSADRRRVLGSDTVVADGAPWHHLAPHLAPAGLPAPVWVTLELPADPPVALIVHARMPVWETERGMAALGLARRLSTTRIVHLAVSDDLAAVVAATQWTRRFGAAIDIIRAELFVDRRDAFAVLRQLAAKHGTKLDEAAQRVVDAGSTAALRADRPAREPVSMRRALAYINEHLESELTVDDVAAAAGVTPRALQASFRAYRNTTPMAYARGLRLEQAHGALLSADPSTGASVAEIAHIHGFRNMGRFATAYRRRFGRSPRQTLQMNGRGGPVTVRTALP